MAFLKPALLTAVIVLFQACVPLSELSDEDAAAGKGSDSLEMQLSECKTQYELLLDRLEAVERENLQLDKENRSYAARLAEYLYTDSVIADGKNSMAGASVPPASADIKKQPSDPQFGTPSAVPGQNEIARLQLNADGVPIAFNPAVSPDLNYLRKYQEALQHYQSGRNDLAFTGFQSLLSALPNDMADNCIYWMGESEMISERYESAARLYSAVLQCQPSDKEAAALFSRARAHIALGRIADARADLEAVKQRYPASDEAAQAATLLPELR